MKHTIRIQLEYKFDVIRDIEIPSEESLECLHYAIISSLKLDKNEIASFKRLFTNRLTFSQSYTFLGQINLNQFFLNHTCLISCLVFLGGSFQSTDNRIHQISELG